jgi:hypothetical protein
MIGKSMIRGAVSNASAFRAAPVTFSVRGMATERQCKLKPPPPDVVAPTLPLCNSFHHTTQSTIITTNQFISFMSDLLSSFCFNFHSEGSNYWNCQHS